MRKLFLWFWLPVYRIWALWYIRGERVYRYEQLRLIIPRGVFHPGIFFSTPVFLQFLKNIDFQRKKVLDVGAGSGVLALFAARQGAEVTALDINPLAVETVSRNAAANGLTLQVLQSDLFGQLPVQPFDYLLINPPYYPRIPENDAERAFFAGENLEYFEKLFRQMPVYIHGQSRVWMILSEDCDLEKIQAAARFFHFGLLPVFERKKWGERLIVFEIQQY
ncbi:MAG: methyltransferase [Thermoanaerobaculia bacterium]|nr:methyltransferase [Thermoanaerobaculia bacterium]